ncbi:MAG: acyl-CoA dehydrogenase family protein [Ramlibacter sp.]|nr:acyl-CoA dehydrogenase family protein [Ramlibacter sp.]
MNTPATTAIANTASAALRDRIRDVQEAARGVTTLYPRSYILQCIKEDRFPDELWLKLGEFGLLGLSVPEEYGGSGGGVLEITALNEALALAGVPTLFWSSPAWAGCQSCATAHPSKSASSSRPPAPERRNCALPSPNPMPAPTALP